MSASTRLEQIHAALSAQQEVEPVSVREFIGWVYAERRGYWVVRRIRKFLERAQLRTVPDFDSVHIDSKISFALLEPSPAPPAEANAFEPAPASAVEVTPTHTPIFIAGAIADPAFRVGRLESANKKPLSVTPDCTLREAITLMLRHDFSQLPVMSNERDVKGIVSWESIGSRLALGKIVSTASECMKPHHEVSSKDSLFRVISQIVEHSYVLRTRRGSHNIRYRDHHGPQSSISATI
jgi:hypothetical protein